MNITEEVAGLLDGVADPAHRGEHFTFTVDGLPLDGYAIELEEGLSQVPVYRVCCAVAQGSHSDALMGKAGQLTLNSRDHLGRDIAGIVTRIDQTALLPDGREQWVFDMHSSLIRLSLRQRWRIVHRQSVVEIVENVLRDHGLAVDNRLTLDYPVKPWTAQVGETDLAFVQRLLAHADIWFSSESDEHGEVVVLADSHQGASRAQRAGLTVRAQSGAVRAIQGMESVALDGVFRRVGHADFYRQQQRESLHLSGPVGDVGPGQWLPVEGHGNCLIIHSKTTLALPREHQGNDPQPLRWEAEAIAFNQPFLPPIPAKPDMPLVFPARVESTEPYAQLTGSGLRKARIAFDEQLEATGEASPPLRQLQPFGGPPSRNGQPTGWDWPLRDGADILLTCLNDDPDQPLILGYAPCTTQPGPVVGENRHQHKLMTPAGHQLALDDKKQAEAITLHTPDGRCLLKLDAQSDSPIVQLACDQGALVMRAGQNQHITVGKHHQTHIGESQTSQVGQHSRTRTDNGVIHYQAATNATLRAAQNVKLDAGKNIEIHSGKHLQIRAEGNARIEAKRAIVARVGGGLHVQANGALSITGDGSGDLTVHQNGGGFSIKKDGTIRLFGNTVTLKGSQGVRFNGQMHYNLGQGVKADSPVPAAPKTLTPIPELDLPPPRQQIKTLTVLPLRHGVFTSSNEAAMQAVPELPAHLNAPFALSDAKNSINVLRAGYVYVLIEREGGCHWQSYRSRLDGQLVSLDTPAPPHLATASSRPAPTVTLHHPDKITNSWWLFTPDPLTPAKQDEYQANAQDYASRGLWQAFSPKAWLDGQRNLPDTLSARQCQKGVLEAQLDNDTLRFAAVQQPFTDAWLGASPLALMPGNHAGSAFTQQLSRLEVDRGAALVLHDAIGMAQSLNAWRNGALDTLEAWQDSTDDQGVSNDWKWQVKQQIDQLHQHYAGQRAAGFMHRETRTQGTLAHSRLANLNYEEQQKRAVYGDDTFEELFGEDFRQRRDAIRREEEGLLAHEATRQHSPQQQAAYREEFERNYLSRLDTDSMQQLQVQFDEHSRAAEKDMERRATEQLRVLQSEALQHALHAYDKDDPASGVRFAAQTGLCTYGLTGCLSGRQLLHDWYGARTLTPENLALRSYAFNQREAETLVQDILADPPEADDARVDTQAAVAGPIKALLTYFERIDAAAAALEGQAALGLALSWQVSLGQSLLRANSPNALDRTVARGLAALMRSSIGKEALHLRLDELARKTGKATPYLPQHSRQAIQRSVSSNVNEAMLRQMAESQHSNFYQTRVYGGLLFLEALAFFMKARQEGPDSAPWYDLTAAALAASAAGTRLLGAGAELAATSFSEAAVSARAGQVIHGGLRLASGTLAATAGGVWVGMDLAEGLKAEGKNESVLSRAYYARSIAGAALIVGEGGMAMAASQPFWRAMTNRAERHGLGKAIVGIAQGGSSLAGRLASQKAMAALGKLVRLGGTTVLGATIAIEVLRPDQLEQWCSRSVFRAENGRGYDSAEDEITELLIAIEMVTH